MSRKDALEHQTTNQLRDCGSAELSKYMLTSLPTALRTTGAVDLWRAWVTGYSEVAPEVPTILPFACYSQSCRSVCNRLCLLSPVDQCVIKIVRYWISQLGSEETTKVSRTVLPQPNVTV